jgi:hypothetical protein
MRFELSYGSGTTHEVQLAKTVAVLGRDPGCDVVLNDNRCSRRHAVVEDRPEGLLIRDSGSANGIHVNGRRVRVCVLRPGDAVRLGDVTLTVMVEIGETLVVAPADVRPLLEPADAPDGVAVALPPPRSGSAAPARPRPASVALRPAATPAPVPAAAAARPLTVTLLAVLWAVFVPVSVSAALSAAWRLEAGVLGWSAAALASLVLAALGVAMALGLRSLAAWARHLQIALAALGLVACPFALAWATVLLYMTKPEVKAAFERRAPRTAAAGMGSAEPTFALSILAMLLLGAALSAAAVFLLRSGH